MIIQGLCQVVLIIPFILNEIKEGNPNAEIIILIATGCHRETTKQELIEKFGEEILDSVQVVIHDCDDEGQVCLGELPSGGKVYINKVAAEADLLIAEGFIRTPFFCRVFRRQKECSSRDSITKDRVC